MPIGILSSSSMFTQSTVSKADIAAAVAQVKAAGVEANLRPLVDAFASANREGRVSATSRKAFESALLGLVKDLPRTPSSVVMRRDEAGLASSIQQAQGVIGKQTTRIAGLEAEVQTLSTALTTKKGEADELFTTQKSLQEALSSAKEKKKDNLLVSLFAILLTSGAGAGTGAAVANGVATINGVQTVLSINDINSQLSAIDKQIAHTSAVKAELTQRLAVVTSTADAHRQSLDGLKLLETSLRAQAATTATPTSSSTLSERLNGLAVSLEVHQALSSNLGKQIEILESMKAGLSGATVELDALIVALKADNDGLRTEIASTERSIKSTLIDMALSMSNVPKSFKLGALDLSTKTLLLDGIEGLRLSMLSQAHAFANNTITSSLLGVPASSPVGQLFLAALKHDDAGITAATAAVVADVTADAVNTAGFTGASSRMVLALLHNDPSGVRKAALDGVLDNVDSLTSTQRYLIEQLLFAPRTAAKPLDSDMVLQAVTRVAADPSIDEPRARAIARAVITTDAATVITSDEPILNHLEHATDVRIAQATPTTSFLGLWDCTDAHLGRLAHLPLESLMLLGDTKITAAGLQALSKLPTLTDFTSLMARATSEHVEAIASLSNLRKLELDVAPEDLAILAALPELSSLQLRSSTTHDDTALAALSTLPALTVLQLQYSKVTGAGIGASGLADRLTQLNLQGTTQSAADLAALAALPKLTKLVIPRIACAETDLLQLASSTSLQTVSIGDDSGFDIVKLNAAVGRTLFV